MLLVLLAGGAVAGYLWVLRQYYVSAQSDGRVAIFRGVTGEVLGVPLHTVAETSCRPGATGCEEIALVDIKPAVRRNVERGITQVDGLQGARETITRLRTEQLLPPCSARGSGSARAPSSTSPSTIGPPSTAAPPVASGLPVPLPSDTGSPLPEMTPEPGVDCRTVR